MAARRRNLISDDEQEKMPETRNNSLAHGDELRQFVERMEHFAEEKSAITQQEKECMAEAKGRGYDTKVLRKIIALRKRNPEEIEEEEAVLDLYKAALGMA